MKNLTLQFMIFFCIFVGLEGISSSICKANEIATDYQDQKIINERIDISSNDLLITEHGIFLIKPNDALPLTAVFADSKGFFIVASTLKGCEKSSLELLSEDIRGDKIWDTCPNGHKIYHLACWGCANWWCVFRCKCCSPWLGIN